MIRMAVIGGGAWGTALATHGARLGHEVRIWAFEPDVVADIMEHHENRTFLPGVALPASVTASCSLEEVLGGAEVVIFVAPSSHLRRVSAEAAAHVDPGALVIVATKGIEEGSLLLMSEVLAETLPAVGWDRLAFLSGPNFAKEVARGLPTDSVVASKDRGAAERAQRALHHPRFRVYTSLDPVGVEVGGAIKNVLAIATGTCDALGMGLNARAALMTRGLSEMARLGVALGADPLTFIGMAGVGDLILTCTGDLSRNRALGQKIAEGVNAREYLRTQRSVAEGFTTCVAARALARRHGVDMPITEEVHAVLHEDRPLAEALQNLLTRSSKAELHGLGPP